MSIGCPPLIAPEPALLYLLVPILELRVCVEDKEKNFFADLTFNSRFEAMQEPRMTMKSGPRITMDSTRLTQHGRWKGKIQFQEEQIIIEPEIYMGSRDRSWGVSPVGLPDSQPSVPAQTPQFYWLWCPANFKKFASHTFFVDDDDQDDGGLGSPVYLPLSAASAS